MAKESGRYKDHNWGCHNSYDGAKLAVLMDIRDELKALNAVMQCPNVGRGFRALIEMNQRDERKFKRRVNAAVRRKLKR